MYGNVREWTLSLHKPFGKEDTKWSFQDRVVRGTHPFPGWTRTAIDKNAKRSDLGFRCVSKQVVWATPKPTGTGTTK